MNNNDVGTLVEEIRAMKRLMILQLLSSGVRQNQIALMLGISEATMSRMLPKGLSKASAKKTAPPATQTEQ
jgi:DNA-binding NarL/FixJ family response regulator